MRAPSGKTLAFPTAARGDINSRMHADPDLAVFVDLFFPDRSLGLDPIDRVLASSESFRAMGRRSGDDHRELSRLQRSDAMDDRHARSGPPLTDFLAYLREHSLRHGPVGFVLEAQNASTSSFNPDASAESHQPAVASPLTAATTSAGSSGR